MIEFRVPLPYRSRQATESRVISSRAKERKSFRPRYLVSAEQEWRARADITHALLNWIIAASRANTRDISFCAETRVGRASDRAQSLRIAQHLG